MASVFRLDLAFAGVVSFASRLALEVEPDSKVALSGDDAGTGMPTRIKVMMHRHAVVILMTCLHRCLQHHAPRACAPVGANHITLLLHQGTVNSANTLLSGVLPTLFPPLVTATLSDGLPATIEDRHQTKLKLKCIALHEGAVQRIGAVAKGKCVRDNRWCSRDPRKNKLPGSSPLIDIPHDVATPHVRASFGWRERSTTILKRC